MFYLKNRDYFKKFKLFYPFINIILDLYKYI